MTNIKTTIIVCLFFFIIVTPVVSLADEKQPLRRYKTQEEKRETAQTHEITKWLTVSPLIEFETKAIGLDPVDDKSYTIRERSKSLELEFKARATDWLQAEVLYEYDDIKNEFVIDEAFVELELDDFKIEIGKLYLPFGEFYSRFITGPLLEFGETRTKSLVFSFESGDELEAALFVFKSNVGDNPDDDELDWGGVVNITPLENLSIGISYISDLSESDEQLLEDTGFYMQRIDALSAYITIDMDSYDISIEMLQALDRFTEFDADANQPRAWNVELGIYPADDYEFAFRIETSDELADAPKIQAGIAGTWRASKNISMTLEYLHGRFKRGFVEDDQNLELEKLNQVGFQLSITF